MRNDALKTISDAELNEVLALVGRGRSIPAVIVGAIIRRLEAAEANGRGAGRGEHSVLAA